jgi:hypothetical protein
MKSPAVSNRAATSLKSWSEKTWTGNPARQELGNNSGGIEQLRVLLRQYDDADMVRVRRRHESCRTV